MLMLVLEQACGQLTWSLQMQVTWCPCAPRW